jgi:hypothetical protein
MAINGSSSIDPVKATPSAPLALARQIGRDRIDRLVFATTMVLVGFGYSLLLPFADTQQVGIGNWRYLDARLIAFAVAFALGFAWLMTVQVHSLRALYGQARDRQGEVASGPIAALGAIISLLPSLLCCSPIVPGLIGLLGLSAGARVSTSASLQHFFAANENPLLGGALALLIASGIWSLRKASRSCCIGEHCEVAASARPGEALGSRSQTAPRAGAPAGLSERSAT